MPVIQTTFDYPPIPVRSLDYSAYLDAFGGDCSLYGHGATAKAAREDLLQQLFADVEPEAIRALAEHILLEAQNDWSNRARGSHLNPDANGGIQIGYDRAVNAMFTALGVNR